MLNILCFLKIEVKDKDKDKERRGGGQREEERKTLQNLIAEWILRAADKLKFSSGLGSSQDVLSKN